MGGEEMMNNLQQAISTQQAEVIAVPLTKEELGIPKGVYQEFGNMGRTSSVPFLPPKEKPHVLWSDSFENWWPDARIAVDDDGYTWLAAEKKLGEFPHICRIDPNGNIQWSVAVTLPDDMILRVLSGAFPFNVSYPVVTCNGAVIFLTTIFESPAKQAFEAYDKTGRLRWRSKWEDMSIQGAWRVSSDRLVALNEGLDHNQLEFYSLADGSLVETAEDHIEANAIAEAGGPHEMPDGSWISLVSHNFVQRYTLPDRKLVWNLLPDPENRIRPVAPMFDDDYVIVGARHSLICADADSGNKVWEIPNEYGFDPMAVTPQGNILTIGYFEHRGRLLLVSKDGSVLWQTSNANSGPGSPKYSLWPSSHVIYGDGSILLGGTNSLQLLRPDGTVAWELSGQDLGAGDKKLEMWRLFPTSDGRIIGANTPGFMGPEGNLICLGSGDDQGGNAQ
jgi:outer membrane protein assembly factor BamB